MKRGRNVIVLATPHHRHDDLIVRLEKRLPDYEFVRTSSEQSLNTDTLTKINPQWIFFPHWSWLIPREIHELYECVIFHMTDLPYGRGGSPLQNLITRGQKSTRMSAIKCVDELDAGPIYQQEPLSLNGTAEEILQRATLLIEKMIINIVEKSPLPAPQTGDIVTFKRRRPDEGDLCSVDNIDQVYDYIRMLDADGYPNAFIQTPSLKFEFSQAALKDGAVEAKVIIRSRSHE